MFKCSVSPALPCVMLLGYNSVERFIHINTSMYPIEFKLNSFQLKKSSLFHKVQWDNEHSFKYTHKNYSGLGTTLGDISKFYFPRLKTCLSHRHHNDEINSSDISRGVSHPSCELCSAKQNIHFLIKWNKKEREAQTELMCPKCFCHFRHDTYDGVLKRNKMSWQQHAIIYDS